jgi:hypothetical protein
MLGEHRAKLITAGKNVQDAGGQDILGQFSQQQSGHRRIGRRLQHHRVTGNESLGDLVCGKPQRHVPRCNRASDAERSEVQRNPVLTVLSKNLIFDLDVRHRFERMRGHPNLARRIGQRLALLPRDHGRQVIGVIAHPRGKFVQILSPRLERQFAPFGEYSTRRLYSTIELLLRSFGAPGERLGGRRVDDLERTFARFRTASDGVRDLAVGIGKVLQPLQLARHDDLRVATGAQQRPRPMKTE